MGPKAVIQQTHKEMQMYIYGQMQKRIIKSGILFQLIYQHMIRHSYISRFKLLIQGKQIIIMSILQHKL